MQKRFAFKSLAQEFLREREVAIDHLCTKDGGPSQQSMFGPMIPEIAEGDVVDQESRSTIEKKALQIAGRKQKRQEQLQDSTQRQERKKVKLSHPVRWGQDQTEVTLKGDVGLAPGYALVDVKDSDRISGILGRKGFRIFDAQPSIPSVPEYLRAAWALSQQRQVGHVVVVDNLVSAANTPVFLAGRWSGAFVVESTEILRALATGNPPAGLQFRSLLAKAEMEFHVDSKILEPHACLEQLLETAARLPASKLRLASCMNKLLKRYEGYAAKRGPRSRPWEHFRAFLSESSWTAHQRTIKKTPQLFSTEKDFFQKALASTDREGRCPGRW